MSLYHNGATLSRRFRLILASFLQQEGLAFAEALPEARIEKAFADAGAARRCWKPPTRPASGHAN